jgi:orotate phosphoribosyltransferase
MNRKLNDGQIKEMLQNAGAVMSGHFVLKRRSIEDVYKGRPGCGDHSPFYVNKDILFMPPNVLRSLGEDIAIRFLMSQVEVVVGLVAGSVALAAYVRDSLYEYGNTGVVAVYAEEGSGGIKVFKRGFDNFVKGRRCLIVEDISTRGESPLAAIAAVNALGGTVVGVSLICNRGGERITAQTLGVPVLESLVSMSPDQLETYPMETCPLCKADTVPINTDVGHGRKFLEVISTPVILNTG